MVGFILELIVSDCVIVVQSNTVVVVVACEWEEVSELVIIRELVSSQPPKLLVGSKI